MQHNRQSRSVFEKIAQIAHVTDDGIAFLVGVALPAALCIFASQELRHAWGILGDMTPYGLARHGVSMCEYAWQHYQTLPWHDPQTAIFLAKMIASIAVGAFLTLGLFATMTISGYQAGTCGLRFFKSKIGR